MIFIVSDIIVLPHFSDTNCYLKFKYYIECFDIFILLHFSDTKGSNQTKKTGFFWTLSERGGGDLVESKISLTEKTEIF